LTPSRAPEPPASIVASLTAYIHAEAYARSLPQRGRLETWEETVSRTEQMHLERFARLPAHALAELCWAFELVRCRRVLPAMRSLQYGGAAIKQHPARLYNTWAAHCSFPRVFSQAMYLMMCGGGIGFSVQRQHVARLPAVSATPGARRQTLAVEDSIEGWCRALDALVLSYFQGFTVDFDLSAIRPRGSALRTAGGTAPGPEPFEILEDRARGLLDRARGRRLRPIECYDLLCHIAEAACAGGSTRAAMLCVFSADDEELVTAKTGRWYETAPWRRLSNNSAALLRGQVDRAGFDRLFERAREWGDPGVYFVDDLDVCSNSCVEVGFHPSLVVDAGNLDRLRRHHGALELGDRVSGFQGATLTEINGAVLRTGDDLTEAARAAALLNTVQASYVGFSFLGPVAELLCERDALLGVSITGMMTGAAVALDPSALRRASSEVVRTNARWADLLGIRRAARATLIKPAGKTSLVFGGVSNGIHPYHADRYFLRIRARPHSAVYAAFEQANPHQCARSPSGDGRHAIFPLEAPPRSIVRRQLGALEHLEIIRQTIECWVRPGTAPGSVAGHNVSNTVTVRDGEWDEVRDHLWRHQRTYSGVALLADSGEVQHPDAPLRAVLDDGDEARWREMRARHVAVDYAAVEK
jgi:ribonucleoside-triphosphate reductase (thioredoxin)